MSGGRNVERGYWTVPNNQINKDELENIQVFGEYRRQAGIERANEIEDALQDESRVSNELGQARAKFDGWNMGNIQNQRPILNSGISDVVSPRYPFFKRTYVNIDSRLRDKSISIRPNEYSIFLNNSFENVQYIRLIDFQTLSPTPIISEGMKQISWIFLENLTDDNLGFISSTQQLSVDNAYGLYYQVAVPEGNYTTDELARLLEAEMNSVIRKPRTLAPTLFFSRDTIDFQAKFTLREPTIWTRDWNNGFHEYYTSPTNIAYYYARNPDGSLDIQEGPYDCYHPTFHVSIYPQTGNVNILCRMEEYMISRIRTEAGRPWIEVTLNNPQVQYVSAIQVLNRGSGFDPYNPPAITISGGNPIVKAQATATVSLGEVSTITLVEQGTGYLYPPPAAPTITLTGGGYSTIATAEALIRPIGTIAPYDAYSAGFGYLAKPVPVLTSVLGFPEGSDASFSLILDPSTGSILDIQIDNTGYNYFQTEYTLLFVPVSIDAYHARGTAVMNGSGGVASVTLDYKPLYAPQDVYFVGFHTGLPAQGAIVPVGDSWEVQVVFPGSGYLTAPYVIFGGYEDARYRVYPDTSGKIKAIRVTSGGVGYTSAPSVTISPPPMGGTTATAIANIIPYGEIKNVTVTNYGHSYQSTPVVQYQDPNGVGAQFEAILGSYLLDNDAVDILYTPPNGTIVEVAVLDQGEGYAPNTTFQVLTFPEGLANIEVTTNASGQIEQGQIRVNLGGQGFAYPPFLFIDTTYTVPAIMIPILGGIQSGPPVIVTGVKESGIEIGGLNFNWWDQIEFFPFDVLRTREQTEETELYSQIVDIPGYIGTKVNNIIVPTFAPVYSSNATGEFVTLQDAFDWDYPVVNYDPKDNYPTLTGFTRVPGVYRLHPLLFDNLRNYYNFGVAQTSMDYTVSEHPELNQLRIGRGVPFKWVFGFSDLKPDEICTNENTGLNQNNPFNSNQNVDGSLNSILPILGFPTPVPTDNIIMSSYMNGYRCIQRNYDYLNTNYLQTLLQLSGYINKNGGIQGDTSYAPTLAFIENVPLAPQRYPIYNWPNFVQVSENSYIIAGERYYYLQIRLLNNSVQNIGNQLIAATNNRGNTSNSSESLQINPIQLNPTAYVNTGLTETGLPQVPVYEPLNKVVTNKSFEALFAKVLVPYGRILGETRTIIFEGVYLEEVIRNLDSIVITFVDYQGRIVDWRTEHSLLFEIVERKETLKETYVSSRSGDVLIAGGGVRSFPGVPASVGI